MTENGVVRSIVRRARFELRYSILPSTFRRPATFGQTRHLSSVMSFTAVNRSHVSRPATFGQARHLSSVLGFTAVNRSQMLWTRTKMMMLDIKVSFTIRRARLYPTPGLAAGAGAHRRGPRGDTRDSLRDGSRPQGPTHARNHVGCGEYCGGGGERIANGFRAIPHDRRRLGQRGRASSDGLRRPWGDRRASDGSIDRSGCRGTKDVVRAQARGGGC